MTNSNHSPRPFSANLLAAVFAFILLATGPTKVFAGTGRPAVVTITIDDTVVSQLLKMIANHDDSDTSIDSWVHLPGNRELISIGASENQLSVDQLKANVKAVIDKTANDQNQPPLSFGRLIISSPADYSAMLAELHQNAGEWLNTCAQRDVAFAPNGVELSETVYLHLGGDWDAINRDGAIFINMAYFHDNFRPSWSGIDLLISHETFHSVQNATYGNPELTDNSDDAFVTALSKIQREGTARMIETDADSGGYTQGTYGFYFRAIDDESIREFPTTLIQLSDLTQTCYPDLNIDRYTDTVQNGLDSGGSYYTLGEGVALAIDKYAGRERFKQTVSNGPLDFFDCYARLCDKHAELPRIPSDALDQIERLYTGHFKEPTGN